MSSSFTPQLIGVSRLRSSSAKKLPEPLRRAIADCLSSPLASVNEPSRTLRVVNLFSSFSNFFFAFDLCQVVVLEFEIRITSLKNSLVLL